MEMHAAEVEFQLRRAHLILSHNRPTPDIIGSSIFIIVFTERILDCLSSPEKRSRSLTVSGSLNMQLLDHLPELGGL
jgi:hypothetical protein